MIHVLQQVLFRGQLLFSAQKAIESKRGSSILTKNETRATVLFFGQSHPSGGMTQIIVTFPILHARNVCMQSVYHQELNYLNVSYVMWVAFYHYHIYFLGQKTTRHTKLGNVIQKLSFCVLEKKQPQILLQKVLERTFTDTKCH